MRLSRKVQVSACSGFPSEAMLWITEVKDGRFGGRFLNHRAQFTVIFISRIFEMLVARIACFLNKIIQNSYLKKKGQSGEQKVLKEDWFFRGRHIDSQSANIMRCLWCSTSLMNMHDFVIESFNLEHIISDARTDSSCLTTDHISTCLMMFSARFKTAQFGLLWIRDEWKCSIWFLSATLV